MGRSLPFPGPPRFGPFPLLPKVLWRAKLPPMELYKDPKEIRPIADEEREENLAYAEWLRQCGISDQELEAVVFELAQQASAAVDCVVCHRCCQEHQAQATPEEVLRLAEFLRMSEEEFRSRYTVEIPLVDVLICRDTKEPEGVEACVFLKDGACQVYAARTQQCRAYPALNVPGIRGRLWDIMDACRVCPIVFSVVRELKKRLPMGRE